MRVDEIRRMRDKALRAYEEALQAHSLGMNGRNITRQDITTLKTQLDYWERRLNSATRRGRGNAFSLANFTGR
jgi:hypothetical protein